ncbi:MAG: response regulator [Candidatus Limnocylindrales bacterium]
MPSSTAARTGRSTRRTTLLVEDEDAVRGFARRVLEGWGYHVVEAANGADGEELARELGERVDLLVSDVVMPQLSGLALLRQLREVRPGLRAVLMSGYTEADATPLSPDPAVVFLPKPSSSGALGRAVRSALDAPSG